MLKINNLSKIYGDKKAVDNLTLHIQKGEIYGFIGHNGAGKTTTIKSCCGILEFDEGEIFIDGVSIKENPMLCKEKIAYIPDNPDLYEFLSGIKYINLIADIFGVSEEDRAERTRKLISAFVHAPKLIIMDEPFVGLDPKAAFLLKEEMRKHCDNGGAIFFSTHVLEVAEKLCDKVAIIKQGKLIACGTMEEVKGNTSLENVFLNLEGSDA